MSDRVEEIREMINSGMQSNDFKSRPLVNPHSSHLTTHTSHLTRHTSPVPHHGNFGVVADVFDKSSAAAGDDEVDVLQDGHAS